MASIKMPEEVQMLPGPVRVGEDVEEVAVN